MSKKNLDRYDLEAEREANALKNANRIPSRGKRIMKIRRGHSNGSRMIQTRIERRHV
jgi:hypothetical protein